MILQNIVISFSTKKIPSKNPGRGLVLVNEQWEFQTAFNIFGK